MHSPRPLEYCFICGEPTGRAGQGDGSLYCECDRGPFCEECWEKHHASDAKVADLLEALEEIAEGKGAYSLDKLTHAKNVIENLTTIAKQAMAKAKE